jgi:hypothetical protein
MKRVVRFASLVLILLCARAAGAQEPQAAPEWRQFRERNRFHIQGVAISPERQDGSRVIIVAEPPPHLDRKRLSAILASATSVEFPEHRVGYDGWVRDAVAVWPAKAADRTAELIDTLHAEMYRSTYKAYLLPFKPAAPATPIAPDAMNLEVAASDLERWLLPSGLSARPALRFTRIGGGDVVPVSSILDRALTGVFLSTDPGVALFAWSTKTPLANARVDLRQFVLDSDLILGAVRKGTHVVIVARERVAPVTVLPPLRIETILQLASVDDDELAQSYERTNLVAGPVDEKYDWAPIYLSGALIDTEYGSLLNITDQLLKSWSMRGYVHYINFPYPAPSSFPFDQQPLTEYANASKVTFNWNTKGAGYVVDAGAVQYLALNRTGALPVDYLGNRDARLSTAEDVAYAYFTATGDPNLVRVVQYAGLYQVFRRFSVTTPPERPPAPTTTPAALVEACTRIVRTLRNYTDADMAESFKAFPSTLAARQRLATFVEAKAAVDELQARHGDAALKRLAQALAAPRDFVAATLVDRRVMGVAYLLMQAPVEQVLDVPLLPIMKDYVARSRRDVTGWIRTPSIVLSWYETPKGGNGSFVGGHNLSAKTSLLRPDPALPIGKVNVVDTPRGRVLTFNPADKGRVGELVRAFGRAEERPAATVKAELDAILRRATVKDRSVVQALAFNAPPTAPRGLAARHVPGNGEVLGWRHANAAPSPVQLETLAAVAEPQTPAIVLEYADSGYHIYDTAGRPVLQAGSIVSATDVLTDSIRAAGARPGAIRLHVRGLEPNQGRGLVAGVESRLPADLRERLAGTLEDGRMPPRDLRRILAEDFDLTRATIDAVEPPKYFPEWTRIDAQLSVPARAAAR